jgi:outer membrane protein assembly factor BamB
MVSTATATAAPGDFLFKITAPDPQAGGGFGSVIAAVDGYILVGEPTRSVGGGALGRAYLFDGQTGKLKVTFDNPEPTDLDLFGESLTGGDGRVFVGTDGVVPRVYAFDIKTGQSLYRIGEPGQPGGSHFGTDLAYGSGSLAIANPSFDEPFETVGRAYLFAADSGRLQRELPNPEPKLGDVFGISDSLAVFADRVVVGAEQDDLPGDDHPDGDNPGRVWVFDRLTGETVFVLENPNPDKLPPLFLSDQFGNTVAANERVIAVGAPLEDTSGVLNSGMVYFFDSANGVLRHSFSSPELAERTGFGYALAVTPEGHVLASARSTNVGAVQGAGNAYLFDSLTGSRLLDIANPEPSPFAAFGWSVAAFDNRLAVSDFRGNVYVFESIPEPSTLLLAGSLLCTAVAIRHVRSRKKKRCSLHSDRGRMRSFAQCPHGTRAPWRRDDLFCGPYDASPAISLFSAG